MDKRGKECIKMLRELVSDVQRAPFPSDDLRPDLYKIWYEHAQRAAVACFEFLNDNFPEEQAELNRTLERVFK